MIISIKKRAGGLASPHRSVLPPKLAVNPSLLFPAPSFLSLRSK